MLHIRPVAEKDASEKVLTVYTDIKDTLHIHFVPLLFQYIAGFEEYFLYAWEKQKTNIVSGYFHTVVQEIITRSQTSIAKVYHESRPMQAFVESMNHQEKHDIGQTVMQLQFLNAQLLLLTIGLREGVKGVVVGRQALPQNVAEYGETIFDQFINEKIMHHNVQNVEKDVIPASRMLAPLFGGNSLVVSRYPDFFSHSAREMDQLLRSVHYLSERVEMEQYVLVQALHMPYPLGCTYAEIAQFASRRPYFSELLYILAETFPTSFPRLVFASALMHDVLQDKKTLLK